MSRKLFLHLTPKVAGECGSSPGISSRLWKAWHHRITCEMLDSWAHFSESEFIVVFGNLENIRGDTNDSQCHLG